VRARAGLQSSAVSHYRDPLAGLKSQVATKRARLEEQERALSPVLRALLPSRLREAVHALRPRSQADGESIEVLSDADSALDVILALHEEALTLAPSLRECDRDVPDPPSPGMPPPWLFEEPYLLKVRDALAAQLLESHPDARLARWGDFGYIARFRVAEAPFAFVVSSEVMADTESVAHHKSSLRTTVPESVEHLEVSLERMRHVVGKALGLVRELELGVPAFDDRFWIAGSPLTTALLTPDVCHALARLTHQSPVLEIGDGVATLTWSAHWERLITEGLPEAALDVLAGIRAAVASG
jgi:hypothetical protein